MELGFFPEAGCVSPSLLVPLGLLGRGQLGFSPKVDCLPPSSSALLGLLEREEFGFSPEADCMSPSLSALSGALVLDRLGRRRLLGREPAPAISLFLVGGESGRGDGMTSDIPPPSSSSNT